MTKILRALNFRDAYSSGRDDLIRSFYIPCLENSIRYDRAVGFFSSALYVLVGVALSEFGQRGGRIRIVCSPRLTATDVAALAAGYRDREVVGEALSRELFAMLANPNSKPVAEFLAALVAAGVLDIQVAFKPSASGIFHDKLGIFADPSSDRVSFVGSANETFSAWSSDANHEGFEVFLSWKGEAHSERVRRHTREFEELWSGVAPGLIVTPFPEAVRARLLEIAPGSGLDEAADGVRRLITSGYATALSRIREGPDASSRKVLLRHQKQAVENWRAAGNRGIVAHVTGAGKTITALEIVRSWIADGKPALILVPSVLLMKQWVREVTRECALENPSLLTCGGGVPRQAWLRALPDASRRETALGPRVTISTMATAASAAFLASLQDGEHLLVVADEVHRLGSERSRQVFEIDAGGRLGLSATPERFGDPVGTNAIFAYFGPIVEPKFSIADAIEAGRLVPYDYFFEQIELEGDEQDRWTAMTQEIQRAYARLVRSNGVPVQTEQFKLLLFQRASVLKQARAKVKLASSVVSKHFRMGDRWLVYCDSQSQLRDVKAALTGKGFDVFEYHSGMDGERDATLAYFVRRGGVLVAIRCLDEGVDIPLVNRALILASSTNMREFIQRRGRVLRTAPGKHSAQIYDAVVVPRDDGDSAQQAMSAGELRRAAVFAKTARNSSSLVALSLLSRKLGDGVSVTEFEDPSEESDGE